MRAKIKAGATKLLLFIQANAMLCVFFGLLLLGGSQIAAGLLWRALDISDTTRIQHVLGDFDLEKGKLQLEYDKALASFERFREDYAARMSRLREELEQKIARFLMEQQQLVATQNLDFQARFQETKAAYEEARKGLLHQQEALKLGLKEAKLDVEGRLAEVRAKYDEAFKTASKPYETEASRLAYVRQELEVLLDDLQKELQEVESALFQQRNPPAYTNCLDRLVAARVKLNVFLADYRERTRSQLSEPKPIRLDDLVVTGAYVMPIKEFKLPEIERLAPLSAEYKPYNVGALMPETGAGLPQMPGPLDFSKLVPSVAEVIATEKFWLIPVIFGCLCWLVAGFLGFELVARPKLKGTATTR